MKCTQCIRKTEAPFKTCPRCRARNVVRSARWRKQYPDYQATYNHKPKRLRTWRAKRVKLRAPIIFAALDRCIDCGCADKRILEFDHVRGKKKASPWSLLAATEVVLCAELAKCDVRCPNCHALRHYLEDDLGPHRGRRRKLIHDLSVKVDNSTGLK